MTNTIFEQMGGTYTQVGDYMSPDLLPAEEEKEAHIGKFFYQPEKKVLSLLFNIGKI